MPEIKIPYVCEHDIDLFLLEEFAASSSFLIWFTAQIGVAEPVQLLSVAYSVSTPTGESDLELFIKKGSIIIGILIENKLDANLQPRQAERYCERAEDYVEKGKCSECVTVILAPGNYFADTKETKGYKFRIDLEAMLQWFENSDEHKNRKETIIS